MINIIPANSDMINVNYFKLLKKTLSEKECPHSFRPLLITYSTQEIVSGGRPCLGMKEPKVRLGNGPSGGSSTTGAAMRFSLPAPLAACSSAALMA